MTSAFLRLFSREMPSGRIVDTAIAFRNAQYLGWAFVAAVVLGLGVFWSYRRAGDQVGTVTKYLMAALRIALLCLLMLVLLQPVLRVSIEGTVRRAVLFMLDASASMKIEDPRTSDADMKRAAIALGTLDPLKGLDQPMSATPGLDPSRLAPSRLALMRAAIKNERIALLKKLAENYDVRPYAFGQKVIDLSAAGTAKTPEAWVDAVAADSPVTPLGDDLRDLLSRSRGQPVAAVIVATDGQSNTGGAALAAAELARAQGVPLHVYGVGLSNLKDVAVASVFAPEICFVNDQVPVAVRVRGVGMESQGGAVILKQGSVKTDEKPVTFDGGEQVVSMKFTPTTAGEFEISGSIEPRADEAVKDNNLATTHIKVIDGRIKVLLVDSTPRWEFKYLQAMLLRDRRVDLKCYLVHGDPAIAGGEKSPYLRGFPVSKPELFDKFDLVILGDIDARDFPSTQFENIGEFVSKFGGGLLVLPGKVYGLEQLRGTAIERMLPVELNKAGADDAGFGDRPIKLELTAAGQRNAMLRLSDEEAESKRLWTSLPPVYWTHGIAAAKPAAEVLLVDGGDASSSSTPAKGPKPPVLAMQQFGLGQVMYLGTDNTWRWRRNVGDRYYVTLWGQMVQRLALPHLLGESKRTQLTSDKKVYSTGERVTVYARLYDEGFLPLSQAAVGGAYTVEGRATPVQLRLLPDEPGMYRGEFVAPGPGAYTFSVEPDDRTKLEVTVTEPRLELGETAMNEPLLREMAAASGGAFYREEDLYKLPDALAAKSEVVRSRVEIELWDTPGIFVVLVTLMAVEWLLRKWVRLK